MKLQSRRKISALAQAMLRLMVKGLLAVFLGVVCRVLIIEVYVVPSNSMEGTLLPGDLIGVSKLNYGARLNLNAFARDRSNSFDHLWRLKGYSEVKRNDVVVFNSPEDRRKVLVKRCVAIPGDWVQIVNSEFRINGKPVRISESFSDYTLVSYKLSVTRKLLDNGLGSHGRLYRFERGVFILTITANEAEIIRTWPSVRSLKPRAGNPNNLPTFPMPVTQFVGNHTSLKLLVPKRNAVVELSYQNTIVYEKYLKEEGCAVEWKNNAAYINSKPALTYRFKNDYYFMLGDNRDHSRDSRWFGLVPNQNLIGKAFRVFYSHDSVNGATRWKRIFKKIN